MKLWKIIALVVGGVVLLACLLVGAAFLPSVQTWAVRKAVAGQPGLTLQVGRVAVGLSSAQISELRVVQSGAVVTVKEVNAEYSAWEFLTKKRVNVGLVSVQGLEADVRNVTPAPTPAGAPVPAEKSPGFQGGIALARLPIDVRVGKIAVDGRALLPAGRAVAFNVQGGGIELGQRGRLEWKLDFTDAGKEAPLRALRTTGSLALHIADDRRIDLIEIETTAVAEGPALPADRVRLTLKAEQAAAGANELYTTQVALLRGAQIEPVVNARVEYQTAARKLAGTWDVAVRSEQLAALLAGLGLPEVAMTSAGKFSYQPDTGAAAASGEVQTQLAKLEKLSPALAAIGAVQVRTAFDAGVADDVALLDRLELEAADANGRKFVQIATLQKISYSLKNRRVALADAKAELARFSLQALPLAWAQPVAKPFTIDSGDVSLVLGIAAEADGSQVRVRTIEPVTLHAVTVRNGEQKLVDQLTLTVRPRVDYAPERIVAALEALQISLPAGDSVQGQLTADVTGLPAKPVVAFSVQLQERLVSVLRPFLPIDLGPLDIASTAEGRLEGQTLQLAKLHTSVKRDGGVLLAEIETLQPLTASFEKVRVASADGAAKAIRCKIGEVPLVWAEAFVPKSKFAGALTGAEFAVTLRALDDLAVQTTTPVTVKGLGVSLDGQALAQALDVALDFSATKRGDEVAGEVRRCEVQQGTLSLVKLTANGSATLATKPGDKLRTAAKGKIEADLVALLKQPVLAPFATIARGNVTTTFDAYVADTVTAKATVAVRNLVARQGNQTLGDIDVALDAALKPDATSGTVKLPLTLAVGNRRSDIAIEGKFERPAGGIVLNGKISSSQILADDFQALAVLAPQAPAANNTQTQPTPAPAPAPASTSRTTTRRGSSTPAPATAPATPSATTAVRDTEPVWKGFAGRIEMDLKKVQYGRDYMISGIKGALNVDASRLAVESLEGKFKDRPFKLTAGVSFAAKQAQPYTLTGAANVAGFDVGEFLRSANPNDKPAIETVVSLDAKVNGQGATLPDLAQNTYGKFDITGSAGVLRALGRKGETVSTVSKLASIGLGLLTKNESVLKIGEAASTLASLLAEVAFDKVTVSVERGKNLAIELKTFDLLAPQLHLTGNGRIEHRAGMEFSQAPLQMTLQLAGKGQIANVLNEARLLDGRQDDKKYYLMSLPFELGGTVGKPDASQLWSIILKAGIGM